MNNYTFTRFYLIFIASCGFTTKFKVLDTKKIYLNLELIIQK